MNTSTRSVVEDDQPSLSTQIEVVVWSLLSRMMLKATSLQTTLSLLDPLAAQPQLRRALSTRPGETTSATDEITIPTEWHFGQAGACLGRQLARSQYLRVRGVPSTIVIGAKLPDDNSDTPHDIDAHAWLEPLDATSPHPVLHRITR